MTLNHDRGCVVRMIRHGQSKANMGGATADPAMIPLSSTGQRQAALVARAFDHSPDLIVTSPFLRARQTAQTTLDAFPAVRCEQWPIQEFTYLGRLHGRATIGAQRRPLVDAYWRAADPFYHDDEKSESFGDVHARAHRFLTRLSQQGTRSVAVFSHGLFMRVVLWVILTGETAPSRDSMRRFHRFRTTFAIPNCSFIEVALHPERGYQVFGAAIGHVPRDLRTGE